MDDMTGIWFASGEKFNYSITQKASGEFARLLIVDDRLQKAERRRFESIENAKIFAGIHNKQQ